MSHVLVLNASYEFLNITSLEKALKLVYKGKAEIIEGIENKTVGTAEHRFKLPSIVRMLYYIVKPHKEVPLTKKNILLRDNHTCQYCNRNGDTVDHIYPKSRGGKSAWDNLVCACLSCNTRKNSRTPQEANMKLLRRPKKPSFVPWLLVKKDPAREKWGKYLFYNLSVEEIPEA